MIGTTARNTLVAATFVGGLLAGGNVDRAIVAMPAWQQVGVSSWADFSRHADLGNGLVLYPLEAIGGALLLLSAIICFRFERIGFERARVPLLAALALSLGGLALTLKAAPVMLGIEHTAGSAELMNAFRDFHFWGNIRAIFQIAAFAAELWALAVLGPRV